MDKLLSLKRKLGTLKGNKDVVAVLLFGSWARGNQQPLSDIDVCIIPSKNVALERLLDITPLVEADVSYFYYLPLHVRERVLAEGKPLIINDRQAFAEVKSRTVLQYLDFKPVRGRLIKAMLAKGVFG